MAIFSADKPDKGTQETAADLAEWAQNLLISMPASSITSFNHRAMEHVFTNWWGGIKLKNKWSFCILVSLWLAVRLRYVRKYWTGSKLFDDGNFKISKSFLGLEIVLVLVIPRMWHTTLSSNHDMACGLIACNSCPLAQQTRANNIANFRASNFWLKHALGPTSCKEDRTTFTSQVLVNLGIGGLSQKAPFMTSETKECLPTRAPSTGSW